MSTISSACSMAPFAPQVTLSVRASWKLAARRSSARAANNQACSGPCPAQKTCWRCVASTAVGAGNCSGNTGSINAPNAMTLSPCPPDEEFCPPPNIKSNGKSRLTLFSTPDSIGGMNDALKLAIRDIVLNVPCGCIFDSHFVITALGKQQSEEWHRFCARFHRIKEAHSQLSRQIRKCGVQRIGFSWSNTIRDKPGKCACWKRC